MKYPTAIKYGIFHKYYGQVTEISIRKNSHGYYLEVKGWYEGLFRKVNFTEVVEDFSGDCAYTAYYRSGDGALCRKMRIAGRGHYRVF